ncbi:MAG: GpE family phage tail protein [Pseudomonadota bacterium]
MADIAAILHLSLTEMDAMGLAELARWREMARKRSGAEDE